MLRITRKNGEWAILTLPDGRMVKIYVKDAHGGKVHLSFDAPRDVKINRHEHVPNFDPPKWWSDQEAWRLHQMEQCGDGMVEAVEVSG